MANLLYANYFNGFFFNNHIQSNVDSEGRIFVENLAQYTNYGVGSALPVSLTRDDLIVGNEIDITGGTNHSGNTTIGTSGIVTTYTMTNSNGVLGQPLVKDYPELMGLQDLYICMSNFYAALSATGEAEVVSGQLNLTGTNPSLNVFNIDSENIANSSLTLDTLNGINLIVPDNATVIINVSGTNPAFGGYSIFKNGISATGEQGQYWLWNFFEAETLFISTLSVKGSILAPNASVDSTFGNIEGTLISIDLTGNVELHDFPFIGDLPETNCEEEPVEDCESLCDVIASIAAEEQAIAEMITAEASKITQVLNNTNEIEEILNVNNSAQSMIKKLLMFEMILENKLCKVIDRD